MTTPTSPPPAVPGQLSNLEDRLNDWLGEGQAIADAIENERLRHRTALVDMEILQASARDAIDRMRDVVMAGQKSDRASS